MALTVSEIRSLSVAATFRLVAGAAGLNRLIEHVNILDFEYDTWDPDGLTSDGLFDEKSIIITSLLFAKDQPDKIYRVVRQLYLDRVSALAVKAVYYKELPSEVIAYANEKGFPIFLFDSVESFSENVVVGLTLAIEEHDNVDSLEEKVTFFLQEGLGNLNRYKVAEELFPGLAGTCCCYYFSPKNYTSNFSYHHQILSLRNKKEKNLVVLPYQYGILVIEYGKTLRNRTEIMELLGLSLQEYGCGVSRIGTSPEALNYIIRESLYACDYARAHKRESCQFDEMGIWQMILPNQENYWMKTYCEQLITKVKEYEQEGSFELYDTLVTYVKNGCDIARTAEELVVHKNTVRYRITKAKEILGMEADTSGFDQIVFLAIHFMERNLV